MDSASATLESPLDSSQHIIAQFLCPVQRFPDAVVPAIGIMSANPSYEREGQLCVSVCRGLRPDSLLQTAIGPDDRCHTVHV